MPLRLEGGDWRPLTQLQRQSPVRTAEAFLRHACPLPYPELVTLPPAPNSAQELRQEGEGWPDGSPRPAPAGLCPGCASSQLRLPPPALGRVRTPPRLARPLGREGGRWTQLAGALGLVIDGPIRAGLRRGSAGSFTLPAVVLSWTAGRTAWPMRVAVLCVGAGDAFSWLPELHLEEQSGGPLALQLLTGRPGLTHFVTSVLIKCPRDDRHV